MFEWRNVEKKDVIDEVRKKFGDFNSFPPNWKEITPQEFSKSMFFIYHPKYVDFRQMIRCFETGQNMDGPMVQANLFIYHDDTGIALISDHKNNVRYYHFAVCEHKMVEITMKEAKDLGVAHFGSCWHVYKCEKCGYLESADSSD